MRWICRRPVARRGGRGALPRWNEAAARALSFMAVSVVDLRSHRGVHPRLGAVDVVPFVPLGATTPADARAAQVRFAGWMSDALGVPCFTLRDTTERPVTTDMHVRYLRQPKSGPITATARLVHRGRRILSTECSIVDGDGRDLVRATATYMIVTMQGLPDLS